jgi:hypothetical protein
MADSEHSDRLQPSDDNRIKVAFGGYVGSRAQIERNRRSALKRWAKRRLSDADATTEPPPKSPTRVGQEHPKPPAPKPIKAVITPSPDASVAAVVTITPAPEPRKTLKERIAERRAAAS